MLCTMAVIKAVFCPPVKRQLVVLFDGRGAASGSLTAALSVVHGHEHGVNCLTPTFITDTHTTHTQAEGKL